MPLSLLKTPEELAAYDAAVRAHPAGTLWQSLAWKQYQEAIGREVRVCADYGQRTTDSGMTALVTIDRTAMGISTWDIPRGPLLHAPAAELSHIPALEPSLLPAVEPPLPPAAEPPLPPAAGTPRPGIAEAFLKELIAEAKKDHCMSLYFSPSLPIATHSTGSGQACQLLAGHSLGEGWPMVASPRHEQPEATRIIDLTVSEEEILAQMKPKGRYNIGVAKKSDVTVEHSQHVERFFALLQGTAERDQFSRKPLLHYEAFLKHLPGNFLLLARDADRKAIAGLLGVLWNGQGIYYYGASDYASRALMAPYALQWHAMRYAKAQGCTSYDLLGVAPPGASDDHPWAGISAFKAKFGGTVRLYPREQEIRLRTGARVLLRVKRKMFG